MPNHQHLQSSGPPPGARVSALDASCIDDWKTALAATLDQADGLDDAGRIDTIRALEELACVTSAAQALLARQLDASQRAMQAAVGTPAKRQSKGVAHQVALARRESPNRGERHLALAKIVPAELPHTWAAWRQGRITEWKATVIARETACLRIEHRLEVDRLVAGDAGAIEAMADGQVATRCAQEAARLDAASVTERRRRAESERRVTLRPAPDTMTYLTALLPVKEGVAALCALNNAAASARAAGDARTKGQVMADALVAAILDGAAGEPHSSKDPGGSSSRPRVTLGLVMSDAALFGGTEDPAHLEDFGPIAAELAREIMRGACEPGEEIWLRRLYASPTSGELAAMDARGRRFRGSLSRFVKLRDRTCRTPWCNAPIRHTDHARRSADEGPTSQANAQGLCEACNYAKDAVGWQARPGPDGTIATTTPTGHTHTTRPPPIATIRRRDVPRLSVDYVLAG